jgi:hypothetical protein
MWSAWIKLEQAANYNDPAVYKIRLCRSGAPVSISRFLGSDDDGLLCIGKTSNLEQRRKDFINGITNGNGHSEGNLIYILERITSLSVNHPNREYEYSYIKAKRNGEKDTLEEKHIKAYVKQFGEAPPLNSSIPNRYGVW